MSKLYKLDIEVKGQRKVHIESMNVRDTSSRGDIPICQVCFANLKAKQEAPGLNRHLSSSIRDSTLTSCQKG